MMLSCEIKSNGDLALSIPDAGDRAEFREELERFGYWSAMAHAFESYACNGSFTHFDAGQGNPFVGLTSAPCVAESMTTEDDGTNTIEGRLWVFDSYQLENDAQQLADGETVIYSEVRDATKHNPTPPVPCRYGAPMGRMSRTQGDPGTDERPLSLRRVRIDSGGYDPGGAYWGLGQPLFWYGNDDGDIDAFIRAKDREDAKRQIRDTYPDARFYR